MKKAVLIIAYKNFQDREYSVTKEVLENGERKLKPRPVKKEQPKGFLVSRQAWIYWRRKSTWLILTPLFLLAEAALWNILITKFLII